MPVGAAERLAQARGARSRPRPPLRRRWPATGVAAPGAIEEVVHRQSHRRNRARPSHRGRWGDTYRKARKAFRQAYREPSDELLPRLAQAGAAALAPHGAAVAGLARGDVRARQRGQGALPAAGGGPRPLYPACLRQRARRVDPRAHGPRGAHGAVPVVPSASCGPRPGRVARGCLPSRRATSRSAWRSTGRRPRAWPPWSRPRSAGAGKLAPSGEGQKRALSEARCREPRLRSCSTSSAERELQVPLKPRASIGTLSLRRRCARPSPTRAPQTRPLIRTTP